MALTPTIARERQLLAEIPGGPRLRRREEWGARRSYTDDRAVDFPATHIFIHITITNPNNYSSNDAHARAVEAIGISRFPNTGISYNRGVMPNGTPYEFQPMGRRGAHTVNDFQRFTCSTSGCPGRGKSLTAPSWNLNINSRAYVICQNTDDPVSDKQVDTLARIIVADYRAGFITLTATHNPHGHRCVSSKSCPGNLMWNRMDDLHDLIHFYINNGFVEPEPPPPKDWFDMATEQDLINAINKTVPSIVDAKIKAIVPGIVDAKIKALVPGIVEGEMVDIEPIVVELQKLFNLTEVESSRLRVLLINLLADPAKWNGFTETWDELDVTWDSMLNPKLDALIGVQ